VLALKGTKPRAVNADAPPFIAFNRRNLVARLASALDEVAAEPTGTRR
jgi:hypothetical protein